MNEETKFWVNKINMLILETPLSDADRKYYLSGLQRFANQLLEKDEKDGQGN